MIQPFEKMDIMRKASAKGRKVEGCYRLMYCRELWIKAYAKLYPNPGNMTPGTTDETIDGFGLNKIDRIIEKLKNRKFRFNPVRRSYIPKRGGGKRPLGVAGSFSDKITQEVIRMILENIYEPQFLDSSHGFRPNRSCLTALAEIKDTWTGMVWCIEGDLRKFFDTMNHQTLLSLLGEKIRDMSFLRLIHNLLKCGYLEDWRYGNTYSGVPQGAGCSPILSSVYLHEFDKFMGELQSQYNRGKRRRANPPYDSERSRVKYIRHVIKTKDSELGNNNWAGRKELVVKIHKIFNNYRNMESRDPFDPNFRRLRYIRYADDWQVGIIGPKEDAMEIKKENSKIPPGAFKAKTFTRKNQNHAPR